MVGAWLQKNTGFLLVITVCACTASAQSDLQKISTDEVRKLVYEAIRTHDPHHQIDVSRVENRYDPVFVYFEVTWPNPSGSPHLGNFAVNPWTGDVFNADGCELQASPSLKKLQASIRKQLQLKEKEYLRLRAKRPICGKD